MCSLRAEAQPREYSALMQMRSFIFPCDNDLHTILRDLKEAAGSTLEVKVMLSLQGQGPSTTVVTGTSELGLALGTGDGWLQNTGDRSGLSHSTGAQRVLMMEWFTEHLQKCVVCGHG